MYVSDVILSYGRRLLRQEGACQRVGLPNQQWLKLTPLRRHSSARYARYVDGGCLVVVGVVGVESDHGVE